MALIQTPEEEFVSELEGYLDIKFDKFSVNRIMRYLKRYKSQLPVVFRKVKSSKVITKYIDTSNFKECNTRTLMIEAKRFCKQLGIEYKLFINPPKNKSSAIVSEARKKFCKEILSKYKCERKRLQDFFNVHHSTIIFYINDNYKQQKIKKVS